VALDVGGFEFHLLRDLFEGDEYMRVPRAFEVGRLVEAEAAAEHAPFERRQRCLRLGARPHVELALVALRVGVVGGIETAPHFFGRVVLHFAQEPLAGFRRAAPKERVARGQRRLAVSREQRAVVVQHLLEVRNHPELIDRVARETATQLVVHAAFAHARERERRHVQRMQVRSLRDRR